MWSTVVMCCAAVGMLSLQGWRTFAQSPQAWPEETVDASEWERALTTGLWQGRRDAPTVMVAFIDFTCPYCQRLAPTLDSLVERNPEHVSIVFQHYPLGRPLSTAAAIAAECASEQGHFVEMAGALYSTLGSDPSVPPDWVALARQAGVEDRTLFQACLERPAESFARISTGRELGQSWGVRGTPALFVDSRLSGARSLAELEELLK